MDDNDSQITSSTLEEQCSVPSDDADTNGSSGMERLSVPMNDAENTNASVSSVPAGDSGETGSLEEEQPCVPMDGIQATKDQCSACVVDVEVRDKSSSHMSDVETTGNPASVPRNDGEKSSLASERLFSSSMNDVKTTGDQSSSPKNDDKTIGDQSSSPATDFETTRNQSSSPMNVVETTGNQSPALMDGVETTGDQSHVSVSGIDTTGNEAVPMDGVETLGNEAAAPMDGVETTGNEADVPMNGIETTGNEAAVLRNDGGESHLVLERQSYANDEKMDSFPLEPLEDQSSVPKNNGQISREGLEEESHTAMHIEPGKKEGFLHQSVVCKEPHADPSSTMESGLEKRVVSLHEFIDLAGQNIANGPSPKRLKAMPLQSNTSQVEHVTKHVADIVLILAGLGLVRSGQEPTEVERRLQAEAYGYLGYLVQKFAPKDFVLLESINSLIEDLALRRSDECEVKTFAQILESFRPPTIQTVPADVQRNTDKRDLQRPLASGIGNDWETQKAVPSAEGRLKLDSLEAQASHEGHLSPIWPFAKVNEGKLDAQPRHILQTIHDIVHTSYPPDFKLQAAYPKLFMNAPVPCEMCKTVIRETANVLACDSCERVFHLRCLQQNHLLKGIPKGDWYCQKCSANPASSQERRKYGRVKPEFTFPDKRTGTNNAAPGKTVQGSAKAEISKMMDGSANFVSKNITQDTKAIDTDKVVAEIDGDTQNTSPKLVKSVSMGSVPQANSQSPTIQTQKAEKGENCVSEYNANSEPNKSNENPQPTKITEIVGAQKQDDDPNRLVKDTERLVIEWVGDELQIQNEKAFYSGCRIGGVVYKLQDCALFRPETPNVPPYIARLQALWEDKTTGSKWVRVNWCYYPADLAMISGRPPNPEEHEIYESNHGDNNLVGTIQGECLVLRSEEYQKEMQRRQELLKSGNMNDGLIPIFLCRWFYDAPSSTFKPATDGS